MAFAWLVVGCAAGQAEATLEDSFYITWVFNMGIFHYRQFSNKRRTKS